MANGIIVTGGGREGVRAEKAMVVGSAARHTGTYTVRKYAQDIGPYHADPLFARQARGLSDRDAAGLIDGRLLMAPDRRVREFLDCLMPGELFTAARRRLAELAFEREQTPYETIATESNLLTTQGITYLFTEAQGSGSTVASSTAAHTQAQYGYLAAITAALGIGDSSTAAAVGDTDLTSVANTWYQEGTLTINGSNQLQIVVAVATGNANFAWNEFVAGNFANNTSWSSTGWAAGAHLNSASGTAATANWAPASTANYSLLSHKITSLGSKVSGVWTLTFSLTLT